MTNTPGIQLSNINLYISSVCNLNCLYCYVKKNRTSPPIPAKMPHKMIRQSIDFILHNTNKRTAVIHFAGGEPLLNWNGIKKAVNYAKRSNRPVKFAITTNGALLTAQKAKFLIQNDFDISISVDSHIAKIHNMLRPTAKRGPTFRSTVSAFDFFKGYPDVYAHITWTSYNNESLLDSIAFFDRKGIKIVIGTLLLPDRALANELRPSSRNYSGVLKEYVRRFKKTGFANIFMPLKSIIDTIKNGCPAGEKNIVCGGATNSISVSADGYIYPCPSLVGVKQFRLGSVTRGMSHVARSKFISMQMKRKRRSPCRHCSLAGLCHGGCTALCYYNQGDLVKNDPLFCSYFRDLVNAADALRKSE